MSRSVRPMLLALAVATTALAPALGADAGPPAGWTAYVDSVHGFSIAYPRGFVAEPRDVAALARFTPAPIASVGFMNPTMASGALAGVEPPDLDVRVYRVEGTDSLKSWLISQGLASADEASGARSYRTGGVSGLRVCRSTMLAPGCSIFVLGASRAYQLTPISREGEAMATTFAIAP